MTRGFSQEDKATMQRMLKLIARNAVAEDWQAETWSFPGRNHWLQQALQARFAGAVPFSMLY